MQYVFFDQSINQSIKTQVYIAPLKESSQRRLLRVGMLKKPRLKARFKTLSINVAVLQFRRKSCRYTCTWRKMGSGAVCKVTFHCKLQRKSTGVGLVPNNFVMGAAAPPTPWFPCLCINVISTAV